MKENQDSSLNKLQQLLSQKKSKQFYASKLGISIQEVEKLLKQLKTQEKPETTKFQEDVKKGEAELSFKSQVEIHDLDELIKESKIDTNKWEITKYVQNYWGNGENPHWQVKAWLSKKKGDYGLKEFSKFLENWKVKEIDEYETREHYPHKQLVDIELNIADFHLAKRSFQGDTLESKEFDYYRAVSDLVGKVKSNYEINKIVFPIGNDMFHSDNYQNNTTAGTPQDVTAWYDEEYEKGFEILANSINFLITQAIEVEVILVQGNHDTTKGFYVAHALEVFFKEYKNVKFQRHHSRIKHTIVGNTFIGYHHGNKCNLDSLPILFATSPESALDFGKVKYREIHTGDKHHYLAKEITGSGVRIQQVPSLSGHDRYHVDNGFINQIRAALVFIYHPIQGKIGEFEFRV